MAEGQQNFIVHSKDYKKPVVFDGVTEQEISGIKEMKSGY